jgi:hypothetical protein
MSDVERQWSERVGNVFLPFPRIGDSDSSFWLRRSDIEREFKKLLVTPAINVCLDGPTGTGKSSLALTLFNRLRIKYTEVQLTRHMDWPGFCRRIIQPSNNRESSISGELVAGIDGIKPKASIKLSVGSKGRRSDKLDQRQKLLASIDEADICAALAKTNAVLLIDDFEKATDELVRRVADMCKLLTQTCRSKLGKVLVVGTGNIFDRLYSGDAALEERLRQFSLGTLASPNWSWKYLLLGFDSLGKYHPANSQFSNPEEIKKCITQVYKACDGLFKGLTALGRDIAERAGPRSRGIKANLIISEADKIPPKNYRKFRRRFPAIFSCLEGNPVVSRVMQYLYGRGIGQIHDWNEIVFDLAENDSPDQIDHAVAELVEAGFLVRTGDGGNTLFVTEPVLAHTLGVVAAHPQEYDLPKRYTKLCEQYKLPYLTRDDVPGTPDSE